MARNKTKLPGRIALVVALTVAGVAGLWQFVQDHNAGPARATGAGAVDSGGLADESLSVHFSPKGGCTDAVVEALAGAKRSVHVQAYSFTSGPIAQALLDAQRRGVEVQVILDRSERTARYSSYTFFRNKGVPVVIDAKHAIAHNKLMLIDGRKIITGSFNFTKSAEYENAENLLIITGRPVLYEAYERNFQLHLSHSVASESGAVE